MLLAQLGMMGDDQLMLEFQKGSHEAFAELFARYRDAIFGFFRRRVSSRARGEELSQEVFLAVLQAAARYEPRATFRTYLYGIAMNLLHAEWRKSGRETQRADDVPDPPVTENHDAGIWVRRAVAQLDAEQREVLLLREYEQLSYEEIAALLRIPVNTVRSRLFRARMALKDLLLAERGQPVREKREARP
jgi:RNA polymerase sigma-70 factor (ECF subfamily)